MRAWPRKRGRPKSELVREQNEWFKAVTQIVKLADPAQTVAAMDATKGTGVYPRDLLMHTISEGIMDITEADGTFVQHRRPRVDGVAFQGFMLALTGPAALPANVATTITWQDPVLDTAAFWDVATPKVITVPVGVTVMSLGFKWQTDVEAGAFMDVQIQTSIPSNVARANLQTNFRLAASLSTGPIPVVAGETYEVICTPTVATNLLAGDAISFHGQILGTT